MVAWNLGSFQEQIQDIVDDIPDKVDRRLLDIVDRNRFRVEEFTGLSVGSTGIAEKYQPTIMDLSIADVTSLMSLQGADASSIKLGDFDVKKGQGSNLSETSKTFRKRGEESLKDLGRGIRFAKANG